MSPSHCKSVLVGIPSYVRLLAWFSLAMSVEGCFPTHCLAECGGIPRSCDSIWEVSSRTLSDCPRGDWLPTFEVQRVEGCCWIRGTQDQLFGQLQTAVGRRIVVYVHGNWMQQSDARERALRVYRGLVQTAGSEAICFIAFSWPSERREGFARDIIGKKERLDADSYYLSRLLQQLPTGQPLGIMGYSFGAPVICGALHLLNGGSLDRQLASVDRFSTPMRVSLVAPAFDRISLGPNGRYHRALEGVDKLVSLYNSTDPILRRFRFFDRGSSPVAAGFGGILEPRIGTPLASDSKIEQHDCSCIGRTHAEVDYLQCPAIAHSFRNVMGH